jgi:hypothetical protein
MVPNYITMHVADGLRDGRHWWAGRTALKAEGWALTLDARADAREVIQRVRREGGCETTHTAALRREDGTTFTDIEAREMRLALAHFLGLTRGFWSPPLVVQGFDQAGNVVWRDWEPPTTSAWRGVINVVDPFHPETLSEIFAAFMRAWQIPTWREPLIYGIQMYVEANGPVYLDTSLILAQAALELLAWVHFVRDTKQYTETQFNNLGHGASDRVRELLHWLDVDPEIPTGLGALRATAGEMSWEDGPHALVELRNAIVHPRAGVRLGDLDVGAGIELHELTLWYLELTLLRAIGFQGVYLSRLSAHAAQEVEQVPWA